ncbi:DsbA family protein [Sulfurimonas sp.]|uniref:DsbA family protein n=1 Tax=Sulfurimonas sp. TaxID=2022749 RepID=UPI002B48A2B7|nr:thioredoxin domain-containing protein [Sulfurimonas sp.]
MSLMLKLLATTLLLSSLLNATILNKDIENFLKKSFKGNPNIVALKVKVEHRVPVEKLKGWEAFVVSVDATLKAKPKNRNVKQKMIWFSNGEIMTQDFVDMKSGISLKELVSPSFKPEYYKKANLIYGNENAKHKVAIFSDPLCPFCRNYVPEAINYMKKQPNKFAIYYYHFPLPSLHPAAVELVKAAVVAELQGKKDVVLKLYKVNVDAKERDVKKILAAFNSVMKTNIKPSDLNSDAVKKHIVHDLFVADSVMVSGTPTIFFDGKLDKTKRKFREIK